MSVHALYLDLLCLSFAPFWTCSHSSTCGASKRAPAHGFDTTAPLWSPGLTAPAEATGMWSERRTACVSESLYTAARYKAYGSSPFQWAQAGELKQPGDTAKRSPPFLLNSDGRFDTFSFNLIHCLFFPSLCHSFSPLARSHAVFPRFLPCS